MAWELAAINENLPAFVALCSETDSTVRVVAEVELGQDCSGASLGRDHNHSGCSFWMDSGGVKKGSIYGSTDEFGFKAVEDPVSVHDLHATILHTMGYDHLRLTYRYAGRDFRLTGVHDQVVEDALQKVGV